MRPVDALVLFGATGDLGPQEALPALYHLNAAGRLDLPVLGVAAPALDDGELADYAARTMRDTSIGRGSASPRWALGDTAVAGQLRTGGLDMTTDPFAASAHDGRPGC